MSEQRLTDEELAKRRSARFGQLPPHVKRADQVETSETDPPPEEPATPPVRLEWG